MFWAFFFPEFGVSMPRKKKPSTVSIQELSIDELNEEIERRQEEAGLLEAEREELLERVAEIDAMLEEMGVATPAPKRASRSRSRSTKSHSGGRSKKKTTRKTGARASKKKRSTSGSKKRSPSKPRGSRKRHRNETNLVDALQLVLAGTTMGVSEVAQAVQDAGYKTTSPNFRTIVNQTLIKHPDVFQKQGRGLYTAKK